MGDPATMASAFKAVSTAFDVCKGIYTVVDGMKKAPVEIKRVATDIRGFYSVLNDLKAVFKTLPGQVLDDAVTKQLKHTTRLIEDGAALFKETQNIVQEFATAEGKVAAGVLQKFRWQQFTKDEVQHLLDALNSLRVNLILAISVLHFTMSKDVMQEVSKVKQELRAGRAMMRPQAVEGQASTPLAGEPPNHRLSISTAASIASTATTASLYETIEDFLQQTELTVECVEKQQVKRLVVPKQAFVSVKLDTRSGASISFILFTTSVSGASWILQRSSDDFHKLHYELSKVQFTLSDREARRIPELTPANGHKHSSTVDALFCTAARMHRYMQLLLSHDVAIRALLPMQQFFTPHEEDCQLDFELHGDFIPKGVRHDLDPYTQMQPSFQLKSVNELWQLAETHKWIGVFSNNSESQLPDSIHLLVWSNDTNTMRKPPSHPTKSRSPAGRRTKSRSPAVEEGLEDTELETGYLPRPRDLTWSNCLKDPPTNLRISRYIKARPEVLFVVEIWAADGATWQILRTHQEFYDFQRDRHFAYTRRMYVDDAVSDPRQEAMLGDVMRELQALLVDMVDQGRGMMKGLLTRQFFAPQEGDGEVAHKVVREHELLDLEFSL